MKRAALALLAALMLSGGPARADEFYEAYKAWVFRDYETAAALYRPAALAGNKVAQKRLGNLYATDTVFWHADYAEAAKWYRLAAEQGDPEAQDGLGMLLRDGRGVAQDYAEALKWFHKAVAKTYLPAYYHLGEMFAAGQGMKQDYQRAYMWFSLGTRYDATDPIAARDEAARYLTPQQVAEAQKMAETCQFKSYRQCD